MTELQGFDCSEYQEEIDWPVVGRDPSLAFCFIRACYGQNRRDLYLARNATGARGTSLAVGFYGYGLPSAGSGRGDALAFVREIQSIGGLRPYESAALDLEDPDVPAGAGLAAYALDWLQTVQAELGVKGLIYSNPSYLAAHGIDGVRPDAAPLSDYGLWLADYRADAPDPPAPWQILAFWQSGDNGSVPGIAGPVDRDEFFGSREQLQKYGWQPLPRA